MMCLPIFRKIRSNGGGRKGRDYSVPHSETAPARHHSGDSVKLRLTYRGCSGSRTGWPDRGRSRSVWGCGCPAWSSSWKRRRWRWSWWGRRSLPRWSAWSTAPGSWRPWRPAPGRISPTRGRSTGGTRGSRSCCLWREEDSAQRGWLIGTLTSVFYIWEVVAKEPFNMQM